MNLKARFSDLPMNLQHDVLQNILDIDCKPADLTQNQLNTLNSLCPEELWNSYLEWNGLVNWAGPLVRAHVEIFEEPVLHDRFSDLPANIQSDLIQNKFDCDCTLEQLTPDQLDSMNAMSLQEMWAVYLDYNGIISKMVRVLKKFLKLSDSAGKLWIRTKTGMKATVRVICEIP